MVGVILGNLTNINTGVAHTNVGSIHHGRWQCAHTNKRNSTSRRHPVDSYLWIWEWNLRVCNIHDRVNYLQWIDYYLPFDPNGATRITDIESLQWLLYIWNQAKHQIYNIGANCTERDSLLLVCIAELTSKFKNSRDVRTASKFHHGGDTAPHLAVWYHVHLL